MSASATQTALVRGESGQRSSRPVSQPQREFTRIAQLAFFLATRLVFAAFLLLTSTYCLLVYVPFTYFGFIHNPLLGWLPVFVRWHAAIYGALLCSVAATLIPDLRRPSRRITVVSFLGLNFTACAFLGFWPALETLTPGVSSYLCSLVSLLPLLFLAAIDLSGLAGENLWNQKEHEPLGLAKITLASVIISSSFAAVNAGHAVLQAKTLTQATALRGFAVSLCFHVVILGALGLAFQCIGIASRTGRNPRRAYLVGLYLLAWLLCAQALRTIVLPAISFEGPRANILAAAVGCAILLCAATVGLKLRRRQANESSASPKATWLWLLLLLGLPFAAYAIPAFVGVTDWDFVLQRIAVLITWMLAIFLISRINFRLGRKALAVIAVVAVFAIAGFARCAQLALYNPDAQPAFTGLLDTYAGADVSFKTAYSILAHSVDNNAYVPFYDFLKQHTHLARAVGPANVPLVANLQPVPGAKPNIFLFVIDSLRRDYVSSYNSAVDFTPEIGRFAQDQGTVVLQNAFTRYGGTALSEPAIWVGAMQLHKQYIDPFYSMNNLQKLVDVDGYHSYISVDPILRTILKPSPTITELENDTTSWGELDFVPTLKKLEAEIAARRDPDKPIFAYSQPQNVHTLTLERSRMKGGRKEISIHELRRMDTAFGEFVSFLQEQGLYDNSIIVLTSDHGDSYGEFGRYGHSNFLFPEVVRIPLIIHLPSQMHEQLLWDEQQLAFTTDITPSLYYLLGHGPTVNNELFGRPLFTHTQQEQSEYLRPNYLIACSYAPVYGMLGNNGKTLFIVDAVNRKNYFLDLAKDPLGTRNYLTPRLRDDNEALIRHDLGLIDNLYGLKP
jgi:hypothetical protein